MASISTLVDAFSNPTLNTDVWTDSASVPGDPGFQDGLTPVIVDGRLCTAPDTERPSGIALSGVFTADVYDFTNGSLHIEVEPAGGDAQTDLYIESNTAPFENYYIFHSVNGGDIFFQVNGDSVDIPYDPVAHRWWRVRHDQGTDRTHLETSPDGSTWTSRHDGPRGGQITDMSIYLSGRWSFDVPANETPAYWDNVNVEPSSGSDSAGQNVTGITNITNVAR